MSMAIWKALGLLRFRVNSIGKKKVYWKCWKWKNIDFFLQDWKVVRKQNALIFFPQGFCSQTWMSCEISNKNLMFGSSERHIRVHLLLFFFTVGNEFWTIGLTFNVLTRKEESFVLTLECEKGWQEGELDPLAGKELFYFSVFCFWQLE